MEIAKIHNLFLQSKGVSTDTRTIKANQIFFALSGDNFNGNLYALQAIEKGASYAVVDDISITNPNCVYVEDVLKTLQELAKYHRIFLNIPILSLTGSNGKTTTKELITAVLSKKYKVTATKGNLNNHIGVPLTLLSMNTSTEFGVVEMGANHMKEIALLSSISQPNFGLITNIGKAHLEGFGSEENILRGKTELYDYLEQSEDSIVFVNTKDDRLLKRSSNLNGVFYGLEEKKEHLINIKLLKENPEIIIDTNQTTIKSPLMGYYNAENIFAAICIGSYFQIPINDIKDAIETYHPTNNRSQVIQTSLNIVNLDAYNANPTSMLLSIQNFEKSNYLTSKTVILGDMFELGQQASEEHIKIIDYLKHSTSISKAILVGSNFHNCNNDNYFISFKTTTEVITFLKKTPIENKQILIKGSRGMKLETLLNYL